jgi:hypothetical protein
MASFTNDPNHYAHPLFQHVSVPTTKKAIKSKNLPSWMSHVTEQIDATYLVDVKKFEPAGLKYNDFPKTKDDPPKDIFVLIENKIEEIKGGEKKEIEKSFKKIKDYVEQNKNDSLSMSGKIGTYQTTERNKFLDLLKDFATLINKQGPNGDGKGKWKKSDDGNDSIYVQILHLLGLDSAMNVDVNQLKDFNDGFNLYNLVIYSARSIKTNEDSWLADWKKDTVEKLDEKETPDEEEPEETKEEPKEEPKKEEPKKETPPDTEEPEEAKEEKVIVQKLNGIWSFIKIKSLKVDGGFLNYVNNPNNTKKGTKQNPKNFNQWDEFKDLPKNETPTKADWLKVIDEFNKNRNENLDLKSFYNEFCKLGNKPCEKKPKKKPKKKGKKKKKRENKKNIP